jgi:hypothetical protein
MRAIAELEKAASLTRNAREQALLRERAATLLATKPADLDTCRALRQSTYLGVPSWKYA